MNERVKSGLLCLLVILSIFLTYQLWFGHKGEDGAVENGYEAVYFEEPRPLSQLLIPERIFFYRSDRCYQLRPGDPDFISLWAELSEVLQEINEPDDFAYEDSLPEDAELCLSLLFRPDLPLGRESLWLKNAPSAELSGLEIWRLGERCWGTLQDGASPGLLLLPARRGSGLAALCDGFDPAGRPPYERLDAEEMQLPTGEFLQVKAPLYVPAHNAGMKELVLKAETVDSELLLNSLFINRNLVREIKERDGSRIYTDGEQGLRLGEGLDYSHPRLEQKPVELTYISALLTAGKLLGYYGGWPDYLRLEQLSRAEGAADGQKGNYNAKWRSYFDGYPLLGGADVDMTFHQGGLVSYRRSLYNLLYSSGEEAIVRDYREALAAALDLAAAAGVNSPRLEAIDLGYYLTGSFMQPRALPVWIIRFGEEEFYLKIDGLTEPEGRAR